MRLHPAILGAFAVMFTVLAGCYADKPIAPAGQAVFDDRLLGRWLFPQGEDEEPLEIVVARFAGNEYVVSPARDFSEKEALRVFVTEVDGQRFLNAQDLNPDLGERGYMFARYSFRSPDEGVLEVPGLDAIPHEVDTSDELARLFAQAAGSPDFYSGQTLVARRVRTE